MPSVLIVEDTFLVADSLRRQLTAAGYNVVGVAATFEAALENALARRPRLALVDHQLKGERDGVAVARHLRPLGVKVVYLTGNEDEIQRADPGAVILSKPCDDRVLLQTLRCVLEMAGSDRD